MLCDQCQKRAATCHNTIIVDGISKHTDLCPECFESSCPPSVKGLTGSLLGARCQSCGAPATVGTVDRLAMWSDEREPKVEQRAVYLCDRCAQESVSRRAPAVRVSDELREQPTNQSLAALGSLHFPSGSDSTALDESSASHPDSSRLFKKGRWSNFLFTIAVRGSVGAFLGCLVCLLFAYRGILSAFSHNKTHAPLVVLGVSGIVGGVVASLTTPRWQRPWYKGTRGRAP